jgi:hypothetical protein
VTVKELKLEPTEDDLDRSHRLWKDKLSFLGKDLPAYILAFLVVFGSMVYSFWVLAHPSLPRPPICDLDADVSGHCGRRLHLRQGDEVIRCSAPCH